MACPYFYPVDVCAGSATLPLGAWWRGVCRAVPGAPLAGGPGDLNCNLGYARGACQRFPQDDGPDAARFAIVSHEGAAIVLRYSIERDHHPFAHGRLEYAVAQSGLTAPAETATLERQAEAYVESYLRRKEEF